MKFSKGYDSVNARGLDAGTQTISEPKYCNCEIVMFYMSVVLHLKFIYCCLDILHFISGKQHLAEQGLYNYQSGRGCIDEGGEEPLHIQIRSKGKI